MYCHVPTKYLGVSLHSRHLEVVGTRKNSLHMPVLSFAHYFQAPATQANLKLHCSKKVLILWYKQREWCKIGIVKENKFTFIVSNIGVDNKS